MLLTKDHITFIIGNDQILQNKLESAVSEITRFQFLSKSNWSDIFISLLPIIIIGVWIFIMRKMSGGRRRKRTDLQYWKIKSKTFDEKTDVKPHLKMSLD
jgi:cell division protease FtsH